MLSNQSLLNYHNYDWSSIKHVFFRHTTLYVCMYVFKTNMNLSIVYISSNGFISSSLLYRQFVIVLQQKSPFNPILICAKKNMLLKSYYNKHIDIKYHAKFLHDIWKYHRVRVSEANLDFVW